MSVYNSEWHYNSGAWALLRGLFDLFGVNTSAATAATICRLVTILLMFRVWRRDDGSEPAASRGAFFILAALVLLSPAVMPWYLIWALPFAVIAGFPAWAVFSVLSLLSYSFYAGEVEHAWWRVIEYGGLAVAWIWQQRADRSGNGSLG